MKEIIIQKDTLEKFGKYLMLEEKSSATIEKYNRDVRKFFGFCTDGRFTKETVIAYKQKLIEDGYAPRSINSMLASLNYLFSVMECSECRVRSVKVQQPVFVPEEKELTREEYRRLCKAAESKNNVRLSLLLQTICGTGIRVSELDLITVEAVREGKATVSCKGKTRLVFIVKDLQKKLLGYSVKG